MVALPTQDVSVSSSVSVKHRVRKRNLHLRGVIYFLDNHFTARVVQVDGSVLFYDGAQKNGMATVDGKHKAMSRKEWTLRQDAVAAVAIYSK